MALDKLKTRLRQVLPLAPEPRLEYQAWTAPDPANLPNEGDARRAGARALVKRELPAVTAPDRLAGVRRGRNYSEKP